MLYDYFNLDYPYKTSDEFYPIMEQLLQENEEDDKRR